MEIYAEYFFIENLIANGMMLYLTAGIWKMPVSKGRLTAGAAIASFYAFGIFSPYSGVLYHPVSKLLFSCLLIWLVFGKTSYRMKAKLIFTFYGTGILLGGAVTALLYFTQTTGTVSGGVFYFDRLTYFSVLTALLAGYCLIRAFMSLLKDRSSRNPILQPVILCSEKMEKRLMGLVDTGNFLTEPSTGLPVAIGEYEAVKDFFPPAAQAKLLPVPYRSIGKEAGMLMGVKVQIQGDKIEKTECILALYRGKLSEDGDCQLILPPAAFREENRKKRNAEKKPEGKKEEKQSDQCKRKKEAVRQ